MSSACMRAYRDQGAHAGELVHRGSTRLCHCGVDRRSRVGVEAAIGACDGEAGYEALDVPLERARQRLVEVVDAEDQALIGRGERAEVGQVRVAAELYVESCGGASARSAAIR